MPVPISIILYDKGAAGVPTTTNPQPLRGVDAWEHVISDRYGFETAQAGWNATRADVADWARADHLGRHMEAYSPDGKRIWEGRLTEIAISVGRKHLVFSLKDMANRLKLRYTTDAGAQAATSAVSSAGSIAMFGTKDRLLNLSTIASAAATNRVQTALNQIAFPTSREASASGSGDNRGDVRIELTFVGWYSTLDELLTSSSSTTSTATGTQVASLLTSYNSTNAFFSSSTSIVATGVSDTEFIDDDSTYREKIETLLAHGNSSQQRLAWGVYEDRRFLAEVWAGATPATIKYYEYEASGEIRDAQGNLVPPWEVRPNAMAQLADILDTAPSGAVESPTRKYVARVHCTIRDSGASVTLEPDNVDSLEALLSSPSGAGPAGTSDRQAAFERKVTKPARTRFSGTNGHVDAGGGTVTNTGGGAVDLGTGTGLGGTGSSGVTTTGGTPGALVKWSSSSTLVDAVSGTDYAAATHTHAASAIVSGTMATARLGSGTASASTVLWGDSTWAALVAGDLPAHTHAASDITTGTMATARLGSGTASASTLLWGDSTWSALVAGDLPSHTHAASDITSGTMATARLGTGTASASTLLWGDSTWAALVASDIPNLDASKITTGTMATARLGSGTASATTLLHGDSSWAKVILTTDVSGVLPVANGGTGQSTASTTTANAIGAVGGNGTAGGIAVYTATLSITSYSALTFDDTTNHLATESITAISNSAFGSGTVPTSTRLFTKGAGTSSSTKAFQMQDNAGTEHVYMRDDGQLGARVAWTIFSDRRLKRNVRDIEPALARNAIKVVAELPDPVIYDIAGAADQIGYLADELALALPQVVQAITVEDAELPTDLLGVQYQNLIPIILLALKQLIPLIPGAQVRANLPPGPGRPRLH